MSADRPTRPLAAGLVATLLIATLGEGGGSAVGLLASAVARPQTTVGGEDAYPTMWLKAAALLQSVVGNHALVDGNKRLGWLSVAVFLEINDVSVAAASNDDVYTLVMEVAQAELALDDIADRLRHLID